MPDGRLGQARGGEARGQQALHDARGDGREDRRWGGGGNRPRRDVDRAPEAAVLEQWAERLGRVGQYIESYNIAAVVAL